MAEAPLIYLKKQLNFSLSEWGKLDDETKDWYRKAAEEEQAYIASQAQ